MTGAEGGVIWTVGAYAPLSLPSMRLRDRHIGEIGKELGNAFSDAIHETCRPNCRPNFQGRIRATRAKAQKYKLRRPTSYDGKLPD